MVPESDLIEFDGQYWCIWHLPLRVREAQSPKSQWSDARISAFNESIFASMDQIKTGETCNLRGVVFPGEVSFERYAGEDNVLPKLGFESAKFLGRVSFAGCKFSDYARFDNTTFCDAAVFSRATFDDPVFQEATFCAGAFFDRARFARMAYFPGARFDGYANLVRAELHAAMFAGARFGAEARFDGATFSGHQAAFDWARFRGPAVFDDAIFSGHAQLMEVTFEDDARFVGSATAEGISRGADTFARSLTFRGATFRGRAHFINRRFLGATDFRNATFHVAPEFHNTVLHQSTDFSGTNFLDRTGTEYVNAAMAYRTLKLAMESVRARDEEARFYGYEQQSLRAKKDTPSSIKVVSWLYEGAADYGQSFALPLSWLFISLFVFTLMYALIGGAAMWGDWQGVLRFALQQVFQPFGAFRTFVGANAAEPVSLGLALLAACHSLLTFAFLALFLLALRRRFRLN